MTPDPPYDRLFNDIKISIPGAVDAVIMQEMWRVFEDFMVETNVWVEEVPFTVEPNVLQYQVTLVGKGSPVRLMMVFDPANQAPERRWVQQGIRFHPPDQILLYYSPSTETTWMAAFAKKITDPPLSPTLPLPTGSDDIEWIIDRYRDCLVHGTLGKMFLQPAKPYSNLQLGQFHRQNYISKRGRARVDVLHENTYGGQRWMYPQGYATTSRKGWT